MFYFKLTNGAVVKWCMVKCCNGEIKISIGHFFFHKYQICSFILFSNTTFLQKTNQSITFNFWSLKKLQQPSLCYQTKQPLKDGALSGVIWFLWGRSWLVGNTLLISTSASNCPGPESDAFGIAIVDFILRSALVRFSLLRESYYYNLMDIVCYVYLV